jgi:hypothetical protein
MKTKGIRISDAINNVISVEIKDILEESQNGHLFYWSILFFYGSGHLDRGKSIVTFAEDIRKNERGFPLTWDELMELIKCFYDVWDITIIGSKDPLLIRKFDSDQEMYESCDIVIEMIDSSYWEVFSKDGNLINRLDAKFKNTKLLESDFEK